METPSEKLKSLIKYAILAPSSHNSQPWKIEIKGNDIIMRANPTRALPIGDPKNRQLIISLGCALQNILTAAPNSKVSYNLEGPLENISITITPSSSTDDRMIKIIQTRRTSRDAYTAQRPPDDFFEWVKSLNDENIKVDVINDEQKRHPLADLAIAAEIDSMKNPAFRKELQPYLQPKSRNAKIGIIVPGPVHFLIKYLNLAKLSKKPTEKILKQKTPALVVISTRNDDHATWVHVGRCYERLALEAAARGIVTGPLSAMIETGNYRDKLRKMVGTPFHPQFFMRLGYSEKAVPPSPRDHEL